MDIKLLPAERDLLRRHFSTATLFACFCSSPDGLQITCSDVELWSVISACAYLLLDVGVDGVGKLNEEGFVLDGLIDRIFPN
jgi:hypothetical protein